MEAGVTSFRSILEKPLSQLTEDDISQLTREDCRKYLKEKGMRRPSWNKSQAIQQVISLKALLETSEDSGAGALRRILISKPPPVVKELSVDASNKNAVSTEENAQTDSPSSAPVQRDNIDLRSPSAGDASAGQMTIFYSGKVNVYDGVPPNKAHAIMHLAASPIQFTLNDPICGTSTHSFPCHLQTQSEKHGVAPPGTADFQIMHSEKMKESPRHGRETISAAHDPESQVNRKVSLQRYLEKRKDRGRFKIRKHLGPISSSLEVYMNNQERTLTFDGQSMRSSTSSPPSSEPPHAMCSSSDNQAKVSRFSVDLNEGKPSFIIGRDLKPL